MRGRLLAVVFSAVLLPFVAAARVETIAVTSREPLAGGIAFGEAGAYEKLRGRAWLALDPDAPANQSIADLALAPRNNRGLVTFASDFLVLRPVDPERGNGLLLYEVNNRGNIAILGQINGAYSGNNPTTADDLGNGFLLRRGFTLVWSGWAADVATGAGGRMLLDAPVATDRGRPITGEVAYDLIVDSPRPVARFTGMLGTAYPFARAGAPDAALTVRDRPDGERRPIVRSAWSFVPVKEGATPTEIRLDGSFRPGQIYQLTYTARDPNVVALGMAGIRDLLAHLRDHPLEGAPPPRRRALFGISQSGRLIQTMLLRGLHVDEDGKPVIDGAFIHVAGGGKGSFDYRFAMPTRHFSVLEDHIYPTDYFPFGTITSRDPVSGVEASVLDRARELGAVPKLFYVNNSSEYWNRAASLIHTDPAGERDLAPAPEARIYHIAGAQHYVGRLPDRGIFANCVNTLDHYRVLRALLVAFQRWVTEDVEPPPSTYPRIADGTLVTVEAFKAAMPAIPGLRLPLDNLKPRRLDLGPRFERVRIADLVPPQMGAPYVTLVPSPDPDGLDRGGIQLPEVRVPLGTRTGFNTRNEAAGFPWATGRWDGSFLPFARTEGERQATGDPRPSLAARYTDRADYERKVRAAAEIAVGERFLPEEEVDPLVATAGRLYDRITAHDPTDRSCRYLFDN